MVIDNPPDFSYSRGLDRRSLLLEAAERLDDLENHLGPGDSTKAESVAAQQIRAFADDEAEFADIPTMYKITEQYFLQLPDKTVPYSFKQLAARNDFYWLDITINLHPKTKWAFNQIRVDIEFNPYAPKDGTRPKAYQIFPDEQLVEYMKVHAQAQVGLDANLNLVAQLPSIHIPAATAPLPIITDLSAGVGTKNNLSLGFEIPPHILSLKADKITHAPPMLEKVWWELHGKEFSREHRPLLSVIVQVPKGTREFKIRGEMDVARSFKYAPANLREAIEDLPAKFRELFQKGAPIHVKTPEDSPWDMTRFL